MTDGVETYRRAPRMARRDAVLWYDGRLVCCLFVAVVLLYDLAPRYLAVVGSVVLVPPVLFVIRRAAGISIEVDSRHVVIRNPHRTYSLDWNEIEKVERSVISIGPYGGRWPTILFRTVSGQRVEALAVPQHEYEQEDVLRQILTFAPEPVAVRSASRR